MSDSTLEGGTIDAAGALSLTDIMYLEQGSPGSRVAKSVSISALLGSLALLQSSDVIAWNNDTFVGRNGAASLRLGAADAAAPVAQTLSVQSVVTGTANTAGVNFTIKGSAGTGSAAGGSLLLQVAPLGGAGSTQNSFITALTIAPDETFQTGGARLTIGGATASSNFIAVDEDGSFIFRNASSLWGVSFGQRGGGKTGMALGAGMSFGFASSNQTDGDSTLDTILARDAANTLALRNGTNAQVFRVYSTYTDGSNYERGALNAGADYIELAAETAGTGDDNLDVRLTPAGTGNVRYGTHSAIAAETVTGYIPIKDVGGTIRKLAVVS